MKHLNCLIKNPNHSFEIGKSEITHEGEDPKTCGVNTGIDFSVHKFQEGQKFEEQSQKETVWVLMEGAVDVTIDGNLHSFQRSNVFDEAPIAFHVCKNTKIEIFTRSNQSELSQAACENEKTFSPAIYNSENLTPEYRGDGMAQGACIRNVRLIFDGTNRPESNLVIGEVINYPGKWSSYPPHHHAQPEIYHYRFTKDQGYGHSEIGDEVFKVEHGDTIRIPGGLDHSQVSAPGYGMYYLWIVRHLENNPYTGFEFTKEHEWTLDSNDQGWRPKDGPYAK